MKTIGWDQVKMLGFMLSLGNEYGFLNSKRPGGGVALSGG
jgi:hypothetical protein